MQPPQIVELSAENIDGFADLYASVFNGEPWNDGWAIEAVRERLGSFARFPRFEGLGILEDNIPVGLVLGWGERWVSDWQFHIKEMCVASNLQRAGVGSRLLVAFEQKLLTKGYKRTYLETGEAAPSRSFYERQGYRSIGYVSLAKGSDA